MLDSTDGVGIQITAPEIARLQMGEMIVVITHSYNLKSGKMVPKPLEIMIKKITFDNEGKIHQIHYIDGECERTLDNTYSDRLYKRM